MRRHFLAICSATLSICVLSGVSIGRAGEQPLSIRIGFNQSEYAQYEPVFLTIAWKNRSAETLEVPRIRDADMKFEVHLPEERAIELKRIQREQGPHGLRSRIVIPPNQERSITTNLLELFDLTKYAAPHTLSVRYDSGINGQPVLEKEVRFVILASSGKNWVYDNLLIQKSPEEADRLMRRLKRRDYTGEEERQALLREYKELEEKWQVACYPKAYEKVAYRLALFYPEHPLRKYAYYWLGHDRERNGFPETAIDCYQTLFKEYPAFPLKDEILFRIQRINIRSLGKTEDPLGELNHLKDTVTDIGVRQMIESGITSLKEDAQKMGFASVKEFVLRDPQAEAKRRIPEFIKVMKEDKDPMRRRAMALIFMHLGADAKEAVPSLERAAKQDKDERVRKAAEEALKKIREKSPKP